MTTCREGATLINEPLAGTAPRAKAWLIVEQPGAWGAKALTESSLDPVVGASLAGHVDDGIRTLLARHPLRPLRADLGQHWCWLSWVGPDHTMLMRRQVEAGAIGDLVDLDWLAIAQGDLRSFRGEPCSPTVFVCTHGARDGCCATGGRPLLEEVLSRVDDPMTVWECSHIGGHRLSPVVLGLPSGVVLGRASAEAVTDLLAGRIDAACLRGRSCLDPYVQVAEAALLTTHPDVDWNVLTYSHVDDARVRAHVYNGRTFMIEIDEVPLPARPESCGGEPVSSVALVGRLLP